MIKKVFRGVVFVPGILFLVMGFRWLVDPEAAAGELGMPLLDGIGRSSQVGDMAAFFLTVGITIIIAAITRKRVWFYPPVLLLGIAAISRIMAWLVHDAALAVNLIAPEVVIASLLMFASVKLSRQD